MFCFSGGLGGGVSDGVLVTELQMVICTSRAAFTTENVIYFILLQDSKTIMMKIR